MSLQLYLYSVRIYKYRSHRCVYRGLHNSLNTVTLKCSVFAGFLVVWFAIDSGTIGADIWQGTVPSCCGTRPSVPQLGYTTAHHYIKRAISYAELSWSIPCSKFNYHCNSWLYLQVIACLYLHSLDENAITDDGLHSLSTALEKLVNLQELQWVDLTTTAKEARHGGT